jgi:hypothetical protein
MSCKTKLSVPQHRRGMYQKFRSMSEPSGVPAGKSGDNGGWEMGVAAVGVSGWDVQREGQMFVCPSQ